jgi:hypothetical protein
MKSRHFIIFALLCASTAASAQAGQNYDGSPRYDARRSAAARQYFQAPAPEGYGHVIHNANDCAPDRAEPVWGAGSALLGYSCVTPSANGS